MGKPSTTHVSTKSSKSSLNTNIIKTKMNNTLKAKCKRKHRKGKKHIIQKLFDSLQTSHSVIDLDASESTVNNKSLIIISDDDEEMYTTPRKNNQVLAHSTPLPAKSVPQIHQNITEEINNLTKEINQDSYITIDLTSDSSRHPTVIDLDNASGVDCTIVPSNTSTMSGESDITVLNIKQSKSSDRQMKNMVKCIANLNTSKKGKLLQMIAQNVLCGCSIREQNKLGRIKDTISRTETSEDKYIKDVILNPSNNSFGSNIYHPDKCVNTTGLRMVVIDGSNVAIEHGRGKVFSVRGLKICIDYFIRRGHTVKAFVPRFRCKYGKSSDPRLLDQMERQGSVVYTPSREIRGQLITSYDDRYIIQCAAEFDGVIVTGDNYRDLINENPRWRYVIENRLLPFTWVDDMIMFPRDPFGRHGPTLEQLLMY